jgi:hypothetical protein
VDGSPAWRFGRWRILLWSAGGGDGSTLPWHHAGPLRQRVRLQGAADQLALWGRDDLPEGAKPPLDLVGGSDQPTSTVMLVHGEHPETGRRTVLLGRPALDVGWHWHLRLPESAPAALGSRPAAPRHLGPSEPEEPVPVRLRAAPGEPGEAGGRL